MDEKNKKKVNNKKAPSTLLSIIEVSAEGLCQNRKNCPNDSWIYRVPKKILWRYFETENTNEISAVQLVPILYTDNLFIRIKVLFNFLNVAFANFLLIKIFSYSHRLTVNLKFD